jgi:hypothetical protein
MLDDLGPIFLEFVCHGTGELILRGIPHNLVRSALRNKPKTTEVLVRGKQKKHGKYTHQKYLKRTGQAGTEKAWQRASDGAIVLSSDVVALLGLLFWTIVFAASFAVYASFFT